MDEKKKSLFRALALLCAIAAACFFGLFFWALFSKGIFLPISSAFVLLCCVTFAVTAAAYLWGKTLDDPLKRKRLSRAALWAVFAAYCMAVVNLLYAGGRVAFDPTFGRRMFQGNFVPFRTILEYVSMYLRGRRSIAVHNLLGNFLLLVPLGVFLPTLFGRMRKWGRFLLLTVPLSILLEGVQALLDVGVFDVDDVLLNLFGALIAYAVFRLVMKKGFKRLP